MSIQSLFQFGRALGGAVFACFTKYLVFGGRSGRREFWYYNAFGVLIVITARLLDIFIFDFGVDRILGPVVLTSWMFLLLPGTAVLVRRLHDTDYSGWWYTLYLMCTGATVFASVILWSEDRVAWFTLIMVVWAVLSVRLIVQLARRGTAGANRFGNRQR